jgi:hypothetical protein
MLLGGGVSLDRALDEGKALGRELDGDAPSVRGVRDTADEPRPFEPVDSMRHRRRREQQRPGELRRAHPARIARAPQHAEHVELVWVEPELVEDMLDRALDQPGPPPEALNDRLGSGVQVGTLPAPLGEREIDVVIVGNNASLT